MDLDRLIDNVDGLITDLDDLTEREMETIATDGTALLDNRITTTGEGVNGKLKDYTDAYKKRKEKAGRYRGFVDLSFTTQMWASIGIVEQKNEAGKFVVVVGGRDEFTRTKMEANEKARPGVFNLKVSEVDALKDDSEERFTETIASRLAA